MGAMLVVGVDENGLGPQLGPLVATAVVAEVEQYDSERFREIGFDLDVGDSKQTSAFGKMEHAEGVALALAELEAGRVPETFDQLLEALSLDGLLTLRSPCPDRRTARQCWEPTLKLPMYEGDVDEGRKILKQLKRRGFRIRRLRTTLACAGVLNESLDAGRKKLQVDLNLFERLLQDAAASFDEPLEAYCGLVGGIRNYPKYFRHFDKVETVKEEKGLFEYKVEDVGRVIFEIKADDHHLPVGLASMLGKYVRELGMARIIRFYREQDESLPKASGYHDPVTKRFVDGTVALRKKLKIYNGCFRRRG